MASRFSSENAPVTLKTIASYLGVSVTTVARALKNGERISPEMVEKVKAAADHLGYVRNLDGVKLRTGKTYVLMAVLSFSNEEEIGDSGAVGLLNGIHQRLNSTDYSVRSAPVSMEENGMDVIRDVVQGRNADGIILDHTEPDDPRVRYLIDNEFPFVTFGRTSFEAEHAYFDLDNEYAAYQGAKALLDAGYRDIAFLDGALRYQFVRQRLAGFERALSEVGLDLRPDRIAHIAPDANLARACACQLLREGVDSFLCTNELVFLGANAAAHDSLGPSADRIGFSFRSGTQLGAYLPSTSFSSFYSRKMAGHRLADLLLAMLGGARVEDCQRVEKTELRVFGRLD